MRQEGRSPEGGAAIGAGAAASGARLLVASLAAIAVYAIFLFAPQVLNDGDTYWHLAAGEWMLDHGAVLRHDPFSFTFAGERWQAHEWLSEILMALSFRAGGWSGLVMLVGAAAALAVGLLAFHIGRWLEPLPTLIVTLLAFACMAPSLLARPHVLALPILVAWAAEIIAARSEERVPSWWLLPLMALWANMHGSFLFGLLLPLPFAFEAFLNNPHDRPRQLRSWLPFVLAALLASLITPHGIDGLIHPVSIMTMSSLGGIGEWRATSFEGVAPLEIALLAGLFFFLARGVRIPWLRLVLLLGLLHMALQHARHQMVFGVVAALLVAEPVALALRGEGRREASAQSAVPRSAWRLPGLVCIIALAALSLLRLGFPVERADGRNSPISAIDALPPELRERPVFNEYGLGGYLIFAGIRPFIDGRADMYGDAFVQNYLRMVLPRRRQIEATFAEYGIEWTVLDPDNAAVEILDSLPGWDRLYEDPYAVIHVLRR